MKKTIVFLLFVLITVSAFAEIKKELIILPVKTKNKTDESIAGMLSKKISDKITSVDFFSVDKKSLPKEIINRINQSEFSINNCNNIFKNIMTDYIMYSEVEVRKKDDYNMINITVKIFSKSYRDISYNINYGISYGKYEKLTDTIDGITDYLVSSIMKSKNKIIYAKSSNYAFVTDEELNNKKVNFKDVDSYFKIEKRIVNDPGLKAPDIVLVNQANGKKFKLSDYSGKVIVVGIFDADYKLNWESRLLERIKKIFPENVCVILGFLNKNPDDLKNFCNNYKPDFPVFNADELYDKWPSFYHYARKEKGVYHSDCIDTNFVITEDGYIGGVFKENLQMTSSLSISQSIEYSIRPYFKNSASIKKSDYPLSLCEAAERNNLELLKKLIVSNKDAINLFEADYNPLLYAVKYNNIEMTKFLIANNADVNVKSYSMTPLYTASYNNNIDMLKLLIDNNADIVISDYYFSPVKAAVQNDNIEILNLLVKKFKNEKSFSDYSAYAINDAFKNNNKEIIKILIESITDKNSREKYFGPCLLKSSLSDDYFEISKYLIDNKADLFCQDENGNTAYMLSKNLKAVKTFNYINNVLKEYEKRVGNLVVFAKEKMNYKEILKKGYKPKLAADYKFPCSQQGRLDCFGYATKHLVQYKYGETIDVGKFNKEYGDSWISFHELEFADKNGFDSISFSGDNYFFYMLVTGEPVIINYTFFYKDGSAVRHYGVAYSFDEEGIWVSDSAGAKRWRMSYDKFYSDYGVGDVASGIILNKK